MGILRGVYVVLVTPLDGHGKVDRGGLRANTKWLVEQGVHGVIPLGSTGEFASLDDEQSTLVLETVLQAAGDHVPVVAGASAETTEKAIANTRQAKAMGASGVLLLPPWYYTPDADELVHHYTQIAESTSLPIMIYNNPDTTKVDIEPSVVARLAHMPSIDCVKESSGNIRRIAELRLLTHERIGVFCGWEDMAYESFVMGAVGWVCVIGNVLPRESVQLYRLVVEERDYKGAWDLYARMLPMLRYFEYQGKTQKALKYLLDRMGLAGGNLSSPKLPLTTQDKAGLDALMAGFGVLPRGSGA